MTRVIEIAWAREFDHGKTGNGFDDTTWTEVFEDDAYGMEDYLTDRGVRYEYDEECGVYFVIGDDDERTGEAFQVVGVRKDVI